MRNARFSARHAPCAGSAIVRRADLAWRAVFRAQSTNPFHESCRCAGLRNGLCRNGRHPFTATPLPMAGPRYRIARSLPRDRNRPSLFKRRRMFCGASDCAGKSRCLPICNISAISGNVLTEICLGGAWSPNGFYPGILLRPTAKPPMRAVSRPARQRFVFGRWTRAAFRYGWICVMAGAACSSVTGNLPSPQSLRESYQGVTPFAATARFCRRMCEAPRLPAAPVYGGNNWYYAYGKSSADDIRQDSERIASFASSTENKPFMVIDDGWWPNRTAGPWSRGNAQFPDMAGLASDMRRIGVQPGTLDASFIYQRTDRSWLAAPVSQCAA